MTREQLKEMLIERVVELIKEDIFYGDTSAIEELLNHCPNDVLVNYLPEEEFNRFDELR